MYLEKHRSWFELRFIEKVMLVVAVVYLKKGFSSSVVFISSLDSLPHDLSNSYNAGVNYAADSCA